MVGGLAVLFDKTPLEASGYAAAMVEIMKEKVYLVKFDENDPNPAVKWVNKIMHVRDDAGGRLSSLTFEGTLLTKWLMQHGILFVRVYVMSPRSRGIDSLFEVRLSC